MPGCDVSSLLVGLSPDCKAFQKLGGTKADFYVGKLSELAAAAYLIDGTTKAITTINFKTGGYLRKYQGRKEKHNGTFSIEVAETGNLFVHNFNGVLYYYSQADRQAIEGLMAQDDLFVILETANFQYEAYGINQGMAPTAASGGTGTVAADSTAVTVTLTGRDAKLPILVDKGTYVSTKTYLETLVTPAT